MAENLGEYLKNIERTRRHIKALEWIISNDLGTPVQIENITCCDARLKDGRLKRGSELSLRPLWGATFCSDPLFYCLEKRSLVDRHCVFYNHDDV